MCFLNPDWLDSNSPTGGGVVHFPGAAQARQMDEILENARHRQGESHMDVRYRAHIARMAFGPDP
jgi:hypothetical protein